MVWPPSCSRRLSKDQQSVVLAAPCCKDLGSSEGFGLVADVAPVSYQG